MASPPLPASYLWVSNIPSGTGITGNSNFKDTQVKCGVMGHLEPPILETAPRGTQQLPLTLLFILISILAHQPELQLVKTIPPSLHSSGSLCITVWNLRMKPTIQFSSGTPSYPTLCNPMDCSMLSPSSLSITNAQSLLRLMSIELTGSTKIRNFKGPSPETSSEPLDTAIPEARPSQLYESNKFVFCFQLTFKLGFLSLATAWVGWV